MPEFERSYLLRFPSTFPSLLLLDKENYWLVDSSTRAGHGPDNQISCYDLAQNSAARPHKLAMDSIERSCTLSLLSLDVGSSSDASAQPGMHPLYSISSIPSDSINGLQVQMSEQYLAFQ